MTLNDRSTPVSLLETRRSGRPRELVAPGPDEAALERMLRIAARTPDHGQLVPFRFVIIGPEQRDSLAALFEQALAIAEPDAAPAKIAKARANAHAAPVLVALLFAPVAPHKIPLAEQQLSCGAAGMNLLHAGHALGFAGGWITGWPAYDSTVGSALCEPGETIAGFLYFGTPASPLEERERPDLQAIVRRWTGAG